MLANLTHSCVVPTLSYLGDGYCDDNADGYNTANCDWDGGDCCASTCVSAKYECGVVVYTCLDPNVTSTTTVATTTTTGGCSELSVNDGFCDAKFNTQACNWDGGDCCADTCVSSMYVCTEPFDMCADPTRYGCLDS